MAAVTRPYLGRPGDMRKLPSPTSPLVRASSKGETFHGLVSGGTAVSARLNEKAAFTLPYEYLIPAEADLLRGFYLRQYGLGPFVFVDPTVRNVLPPDVASCGVRTQAALGWTATAGTLGRTTDATLPADAAGSGVLTWTSATASATLAPTFDALTAPPCLPPLEAVTVSAWVKCSASASIRLQILGLGATGTAITASLQQTLTVGTTWTLMQMTCPTSNSTLNTSVFVLPRLVAPSASPPATISVAAVQVEFNDSRTGWQFGYGSPRVLPNTPPGREVPLIGYSNHTFALSEV